MDHRHSSSDDVALAKYASANKLLKWIFVIAFCFSFPAALLFLIRETFHFLFSDFESDNSSIRAFYADIPLILFSSYGGTVGAMVSYIFTYFYNAQERNSEGYIYQIGRFLFGGALGIATFFFIRAGIPVKLFYKSAHELDLDLLSYHSIVITALLAGLLAPKLVLAVTERSTNALRLPKKTQPDSASSNSNIAK